MVVGAAKAAGLQPRVDMSQYSVKKMRGKDWQTADNRVFTTSLIWIKQSQPGAETILASKVAISLSTDAACSVG